MTQVRGSLSFDGRGVKLDTGDDADIICKEMESKNINVLILGGNTFGVDAAERIGMELTSHPNSSASSSEIDEEDCERKKAIITDSLRELDKQFANLREQLYQARKERVISKLDQVKAGKAPEYLQPLEELQDQMRIRTEVAGILKDFRLKNIRCQYDAEQLAAKQNFDSEKRAIIDSIRFDIEEKLRHLDEDRNALDYTETPIEHYGMTRDHLFLPDRRRKPVSISGPYIIYMLHDHEIMEDHALIRKAIQISLARDCA